MRILLVHNQYQQAGGEDACFRAEADLLERNGHPVMRLEFSNDVIPVHPSAREAAQLAMTTVWSSPARKDIRAAIDAFSPDVVHFHNTFPLVSPGAYSAVRAAGLPVVQTLHNYRLLCPGATLYRDGQPCEDCLGKLVPYPGVRHACYRGSMAQSGVVAAMLTAHRLRRTWSRDVDRYIALTEFAKRKFIAGGLPEHLLTVKPNFARSSPEAQQEERSGDFLFVGRLAQEKGIATLLDALAHLDRDMPIRIVGDGPLRDAIDDAGRKYPQLQIMGQQHSPDVIHTMQTTKALVFPSTWYEGFPMTIVEAFAAGLPVIASRLGSMAEIIQHGDTGLLFEPGNPHDLADAIKWAAHNPADMERMGCNARRVYEQLYTPERNYAQLMEIYEGVIASAPNRQKAAASIAD